MVKPDNFTMCLKTPYFPLCNNFEAKSIGNVMKNNQLEECSNPLDQHQQSILIALLLQ